MRINDFHIHVGQFNDKYFSPESVWSFLKSVGVDYFAVSSSSICGYNINQALSDIKQIVSLSAGRAYPVLWLMPGLFSDEPLNVFLKSGISWKCVKMHGFHDWTNGDIEKALSVARILNVPFMMHTGGRKHCDAGQYYSICKKNPNQQFVLAHSRPCDETIDVMKKCENVWADTAFTPIEDVVKIIEAGFEDRVMWGSDYPIPELYYKHCSIKRLYLEKIESLSSVITSDIFDKITKLNFNRFLEVV